MKSACIALAFIQFSVSTQWAQATTLTQNAPIIQTPTIKRDVIASVATPSLTQAQMDIIVAMDEFDKHPANVFRVAELNEAVYGAWLRNGAGLFDPTTFSQALAPDSAPLLLIPNLHQAAKVKTVDQDLSDTASDTFAATDLDDFKTSRAEKEMNGAVELGAVAASFFGPEAALGAGLLKAGYPYIRDEIARELQMRGIPLASVRARAILGYANATQEIRSNTAIGKALQPYYSQLTTNDPKVDSNTKEAVRSAKADLQSYAAAKNSEGALLETKGIRGDIKTLQNGLARVKAKLEEPAKQSAPSAQNASSVEKPAKEYDEDLVFNLRQAEGTLFLAGYLMQIGGKNDAAQLAFGMAGVVGKVGNLVEKAAEMAPMMLAAGYVGVALGVVSLFSGTAKSDSPFPAIFEMLKQISRQIDDLRVTLTNKLDRMDVRFGNLINQTILLSEAIKGNADQIRMQLNTLTNQLTQVSVKIREGQFATIEFLLRKDDQNCFQYDGNRLPMAPFPNFQSCKSGYLDRANEFSRSVLSSASAESRATSEWRETDQLFPYGGQYDKLREALQIQSTLDGRRLADPNAWYAATTRFLTLLRNFPKNIEAVDLDPQTGATSLDLDPTIETGRSIQEFLRKAAFNQDGNGLNKKSFQRLFGIVTDNYRSVLQQLRREMASTGVHADITRGNVQQIDMSYDFRFLKGNSVDFCGKETHPTLAGSKSLSGINDGGAHGIPYIAPLEAPPQRNMFGGPVVFFVVGQLEPRIDGWIRGSGKESFQPDRSILDVIDPEVLLAEQIDPQEMAVNLCISRFDVRELEVVGEEYRGRLDLGYKVFATYRNRDVLVRDLGGSMRFSIPRFYIVSTRDGNIDREEVGTLVSAVMGQVHGKMSLILSSRYDERSVDGLAFVGHFVSLRLFRAQTELRLKLQYAGQSEAVENARYQLQMLTSVGLNSHLASVSEFVSGLEASRLLPTIDELVDRVVLRGHSIDTELENVNAAANGFENDLNKLSEVSNLKPPTDALDARIAQLEFIKDLRVAQWKQQKPLPMPLRP